MVSANMNVLNGFLDILSSFYEDGCALCLNLKADYEEYRNICAKLMVISLQVFFSICLSEGSKTDGEDSFIIAALYLFNRFKFDQFIYKSGDARIGNMNITQRLLEMMGSRLEVESVYGRGSTFSFTVTQEVLDWKPVGELKMNLRRGRAANVLDVRAGGKFTAPAARILVVDDTEMNLKVIKGLLKRTLIQVDVVLSGPECLQLVKKVHYDMIFLDHRMVFPVRAINLGI